MEISMPQKDPCMLDRLIGRTWALLPCPYKPAKASRPLRSRLVGFHCCYCFFHRYHPLRLFDNNQSTCELLNHRSLLRRLSTVGSLVFGRVLLPGNRPGRPLLDVRQFEASHPPFLNHRSSIETFPPRVARSSTSFQCDKYMGKPCHLSAIIYVARLKVFWIVCGQWSGCLDWR